MGKTFDELFNDFFKRNKNKGKKITGDDLRDEAKRLIEMLSSFNEVENDENLEGEIDATLGKPDKIEFYNEDELFIERRIWYTPNGELVKLIVSDDPFLIPPSESKKSLQQLLDEAIENEDYEKAAEIRDKMGKMKKK